MERKQGKAKAGPGFNFKEQDAFDTLSDCGSKIAFLVDVFDQGGLKDMSGANAGLSLILREILSDMDESIQYLRSHPRRIP